MTTTLVTLTGDVTDAIGTDFDPRRTKAYVRHNTPKIVTDEGPIHLGGGTVNVAADGTFTLPNVVASTSLVENLQATVYVDYEDRATRQRATATFGPYDLSGETGTVDVRDLEAVQALDPSFASETMATMRELLAQMEEISGLANSDEAQAYNIEFGPETKAALSASTADGIADDADPRAEAIDVRIGDKVSTDAVDPESAIGASFLAAVNSRLSATLATDATRALVRKMRAGTDSANVTILGDSTANEAAEFFQLAMVALAARFPAWTLRSRLWNHANQNYDVATTLQTGTGGERSLYCNLSNGAYMATPDSAAVSITGDLEVQIKVAVDDWTPATAIDLCGKSGAIPQAGWFLRLNTAGTLSLFWSADGSTVPSATSSVAVPFADGAAGCIKVTLDVNNGASGRDVKFYTSTDGTAWTQLGTTQTAAGVTSIYDNTTTLNFPGRAASGPGGVGGGVAAYWMRVYNGIGGTLVATCDATNLINSATPFTDSQGNVWTPATVAIAQSGDLRGAPVLTLYNASTPGEAIAYSNDGTRFPKQTYQQSMDLAFINYGHNEGNLTAYRTPYKTLSDAMLAKWPDCGVVAVVQNPQTAPRTDAQIRAHASRGDTIRSLAASQRYALLDAYDAMVTAPGPMSTWVAASDGVHPTTAGSQLIAAAAADLFAA